MHLPALVAMVALSMSGCESRKTKSESSPAPGATEKAEQPRAQLVDLTAASTLAPVRAAFNAHKGEARFLTLLSPT
jgi:hypothetical protein